MMKRSWRGLVAALLVGTTLAIAPTAVPTATADTPTTFPAHPGLEVHARPRNASSPLSPACEAAGPCYAMADLPDGSNGYAEIVGGHLGSVTSFGSDQYLQLLKCQVSCVAFGETGIARIVDGALGPIGPISINAPIDASCTAHECSVLAYAGDGVQVQTFRDGQAAPIVAELPVLSEPAWVGIECPVAGWCIASSLSGAPLQYSYATIVDGVPGPEAVISRMPYDIECTCPNDCLASTFAFDPGYQLVLGVGRWNGTTWSFTDLPGYAAGSLDIVPQRIDEQGGRTFACQPGLRDCWMTAQRSATGEPVLFHLVDGVVQPVLDGVIPSESGSYRGTWAGVACSAVEGCLALTAGSGPTQYTVTGLPLAYGLPDTTAPTATIASPADGQEVVAGEALAADLTCTDEVDGSGIASCVGTIDGDLLASGDGIPTDVVGDHVVTLTPTDGAGNVGPTVTSTFTVLPGSKVGDVIPGQSISTGDEASPTAPVQTSVTTANGGDGAYRVTIEPTEPGAAPQGFTVLDQAVAIHTARDEGSAANPHRATFAIDRSVLGTTAPEDVVVTRDGAVVAPCDADEPVAADPEPCAEPVVIAAPPSDDVLITVRTAHFSDWGFATRTAPTANDDSYAVTEGDTLSVAAPGVLANDDLVTADGAPAPRVDLDGGSLSGTLDLEPDGSFTYTPADGFVGTETFRYHASQGHGDEYESNSAEVTIEVAERQQVETHISAEPFLVKVYFGVLPLYTLKLDAALVDDDGTPVVGEPVVFSRKGVELCTAVTGLDGHARCNLLSSKPMGLLQALASLQVDATYAGSEAYGGSSTIAPWLAWG